LSATFFCREGPWLQISETAHVRNDYRHSGVSGSDDCGVSGGPSDPAPQLIGLRRRHAWLHTARSEVLTLSNEHLVYEARTDTTAITVALNLSGQTAQLPVPPSACAMLAGNGNMLPDRNAVRLPGHGWAVLGADT
jgi:hypothetical protein